MWKKVARVPDFKKSTARADFFSETCSYGCDGYLWSVLGIGFYFFKMKIKKNCLFGRKLRFFWYFTLLTFFFICHTWLFFQKNVRCVSINLCLKFWSPRIFFLFQRIKNRSILVKNDVTLGVGHKGILEIDPLRFCSRPPISMYLYPVGHKRTFLMKKIAI